MAKKTFEQYKGEQVNQIPAGYVEAMGSLGKAYADIGANIGKAITAAGEKYRADSAAKEEADEIVNQNNAEIKRFLDSGDLVVGKDGKVAPAPGKEAIFNNEKLNDALGIYNKTQGRPASELSGTEARGVLAQYGKISEKAKAEREQRKLDLEERKYFAQEAESKARIAGDAAKRDLEEKKFRLDGYAAAQAAEKGLAERHSSERESEFMQRGGLDPANEARRRQEAEAAKGDTNSFRQEIFRYLDPQRSGQEPVSMSGFGNYGVGLAGPTGTPSASGEEAAPSATPAVSPEPEKPVGVTPSAPQTGAPATPPPKVVPIAEEAAAGYGEPATGPGVVANPDGTYTIDTTGADTENFQRPLRTSQDDAYVFGDSTVKGIALGKSSDGKLVVRYNKFDATNQMPLVKDVTIANRLLSSGRIRDFTASEAQIEYIKKSGAYPVLQEAGPAWNKALVASLVAQGKLQPEPGQSREFLGQGEETVFATVDDLKPSSNVDVVEPSAPPSTVPGMTGLVPTPPGMTIFKNMQAAGITPSPGALQRLKYLDDNYQWQFRATVEIENARAASQQARLAQAQSVREMGETASIMATLGTKIGEAMTGYPGVFESSGQQYGFFSRSLPNNTLTGKPWTKADITYVVGNMSSENESSRSAALNALPVLRSDLARNAVGEKSLKDASKATADFTNTMGALGAISIELGRQTEKGTFVEFLRTTMESVGIAPGGGEMRAAKIHQLFLMGSLREPIVGPGNPAIYEQMLLQSAIPSVDALMRIPSWETKRLQTLALVSVGSYLTSMTQAGLTPTPDSVKFINERLRAAYGPKFVDFKAEDLIGPDGWMNVRANPAKAEAWLQKRNLATARDFQRAG